MSQELPPIQSEAVARTAAKEEISRTVVVAESAVIQIGDIWPSARTSHPFGLLCDGAEHAVAAYLSLYAVIGHKFGGSGDHFRVPDLIGRYVTGRPEESVLGDVIGANTVDLSHPHKVDPPPTESSSTGSQAVGLLGVLSTGAPPNGTVEVDIPEFDSGSALGDHDNRPASVYLNYFIRYK